MARAASAHPEVHAYRNWRGQLVTHSHVDITTPVEISTPGGLFGLPHVIRDTDIRDVQDLTTELRRVKRDPSTSGCGRLLERVGPVGTRIPGVLPAMYAVMARPTAARQKTGTVAVTAVGMFADGGGFGLAPMTPMSLQVVVGGTSPRPLAIDGEIVVRDVLDLTVSIDHNVLDGAPATRSGAALRELMETVDALRP